MSKLGEEILALHFGEEISGKAIAERLGCTAARVSQVLTEAGIKKAVNRTKASMSGSDLKDPKRADLRLRKFSWEDEA